MTDDSSAQIPSCSTFMLCGELQLAWAVMHSPEYIPSAKPACNTLVCSAVLSHAPNSEHVITSKLAILSQRSRENNCMISS